MTVLKFLLDFIKFCLKLFISGILTIVVMVGLVVFIGLMVLFI